MFPEVTLKEGKDRKVRNFHPWIYRDEIARVDRNVERMPPSGGIIAVCDAGGMKVAKGWYSPKARLAIRVLTLDLSEDLDLKFFRKRIEKARALGCHDRARWVGCDRLCLVCRRCGGGILDRAGVQVALLDGVASGASDRGTGCQAPGWAGNRAQLVVADRKSVV